MKKIIMMVLLMTVLPFQNIKVFGKVKQMDTLLNVKKPIEMQILHNNWYFFWNVPNLISIRCKQDIINEILLDSGKVKRINDTIFEITPFNKNATRLTFLCGNHSYNKLIPVRKLPSPSHLYFKGIPRTTNRDEDYLYTSDELKRSSNIVAESEGYIFKIKHFWLGFSSSRSVDRAANSPEFHSEAIGIQYINEIGERVDVLGIFAQNVELISPDSTITHHWNMSLGTLVKDSTSLIVRRYGGYVKMRSNLRIKVTGIPENQDLKTIDEIIEELNLCLPTLKVKRVDLYPSMTINFDTIRKLVKDPHNIVYSVRTRQWANSNLFFPLIQKMSLNINCNYYTQSKRDSILWRVIAGSLFIYPHQIKDYDNSVIIGSSNKNGLTKEDKFAIKTLFSKGIDNKIKEIYPPGNYDYPSLNFIFILLFNILLFYVLHELLNYLGWSSVIKNHFIRRCVDSFLIAQMVILSIWILKDEPFKDFSFLQYEIYFGGFSLVTGGFFLFTDGLIQRLVFKWSRLRLIINPIFTMVSLYLAYQFIYLFVRGEILSFQTIDNHALFIAFSITIVRFSQIYLSTKISDLIQDKEFEIIKQKELKNRAELNALYARISPHFLYNALNSVAALARIDSKRTENMALSLSKLFRFTLNTGENLSSTIGLEIEMAELYLEIEKNRFAERLRYSIQIEDKLKERSVPRLLLQPLVENSIKHGISKITGQGIIELKVIEQETDLIIEIYDNGPDFPQGLISGFGLQNTYDKLELVYKRPYEIKFINNPVKFLQIKLK